MRIITITITITITRDGFKRNLEEVAALGLLPHHVHHSFDQLGTLGMLVSSYDDDYGQNDQLSTLGTLVISYV